MGWSNMQVMLGSASSGTSPNIFVGDARLLTVSVQTSTGSASNITIALSNNDGFTSADSTFFYSVVTVLPAQGIFTIDPGARWIKAERANIAMTSAASHATVMVNRYYES